MNTEHARRAATEALYSKIEATLVYESKLKEYEAACWIDLPGNLEQAAASAHSALDAVLDATRNQIKAQKTQFRGAP